MSRIALTCFCGSLSHLWNESKSRHGSLKCFVMEVCHICGTSPSHVTDRNNVLLWFLSKVNQSALPSAAWSAACFCLGNLSPRLASAPSSSGAQPGCAWSPPWLTLEDTMANAGGHHCYSWRPPLLMLEATTVNAGGHHG